jgi:glyoxalase/bleomycin resistance protein/dioxygenase superfamily protein
MLDVPKKAVTDDLLGNVVQICLVTRDQKRTMDSLLRLGIGPWKVQTLRPGNVTDMRFRGAAHSFVCKMAYAYSANMMWEVVEPVEGTGVFDEFLRQHGEGVHHAGFLCPGRSFTEAMAEFERRGFNVIQSGRAFGGKVGYAFIGTDDELGVFFEIWDHPPAYSPPAPDEWYPAAPLDQ